MIKDTDLFSDINNINDNIFGSDDESSDISYLERYGTDITQLAKSGKIEDCFGREKELLQLMEILVRRQKNNPVLIGEAGVGKTAIVELFAKRLVENLVPFVLSGRRIISLEIARILAGAKYRGEFELRFQKVLDEVLEEPNTIIFIDEIHTLMGAGLSTTGSSEGSMDAANLLKPILSRSGFQCVGATTFKEYKRIENDAALNRRFQPIRVEELTAPQTVEILFGLRPTLEAYHNVVFLPGALQLAVDLSVRYIQDRFLPDKAIDIVDRAGAKEVIRMTNITSSSILGAIVNTSLVQLGKLRVEAFRRGDLPSQFILQEVDNAYRHFILRWLEDPTSISEEKEILLNAVSNHFYTKMKLTVLARVDELLFASPLHKNQTTIIEKFENISSSKNMQLLEFIESSLNSFSNDELKLPLPSVYRMSVFLFNKIIEAEKNNLLIESTVKKCLLDIKDSIRSLRMLDHLACVRFFLDHEKMNFVKSLDFSEEDFEKEESIFEALSELETNRIDIFKNYISELKPLLRKGILESLVQSSHISLTDEERNTIYTLLGFFGTETGKSFLVNLEQPWVIQAARRLGDFSGLKKRITQADIQVLVSEMVNIPIQSISNEESTKLLKLEENLHQRVIGQEEAVTAISKAIRRSRLGIQNPNRPIASFFFCGPTGVGKTEVTKALATCLFGSDNDMIRFDMSEFMEKFTISRLIGSPPGYIGYDEGGQLTESVRRKPYSVVLLDEIEKAHPDILNILLQILEDGRLTDSQKRLISFENTVIIMTSNAAADEIQEITKNVRQVSEPQISNNSINEDILYEDDYSGTIKFLKSPINENYFNDLRKELLTQFEKSLKRYKTSLDIAKSLKPSNKKTETKNSVDKEFQGKLKTAVFERLSTMFLPEFLNRLDDIIVFEPLQAEHLQKICEIMVSNVIKRLEKRGVKIEVQDSVKLKLTREGYNPLFGARPLRRLITKHIEDLISETLLLNMNGNKVSVIKLLLNDKSQIVTLVE